MNAYKILKYASISTIEKRFKILKQIRLCHFIYSCFKIDLLPINVHIHHSLYKKGLLTNVIGYLIYATGLVYACKYKHQHYVKYWVSHRYMVTLILKGETTSNYLKLTSWFVAKKVKPCNGYFFLQNKYWLIINYMHLYISFPRPTMGVGG